MASGPSIGVDSSGDRDAAGAGRRTGVEPSEWLAMAALLIASLGILFAGEQAIVAAFGLALCALAFPFARYLVAPFLFFLLGLCVLVNEVPVTVGVKWYGADIVIFFFGVAVLLLLYRGQKIVSSWDRFERGVALLLLVSTVYGLFCVAMGLFARGYEANDVLGDFRRRFFYPLVLIVPWIIPLPKRVARHVALAVAFATLSIFLIGGYRAGTGTSWEEEKHTGRDDIVQQMRYLSYTEVTTVALALGYFAAFAAARRTSWWRPFALVMAAISTAFMVISGWRLAVPLSLIMLMGGIGLAARARGRRMGAVFGTVAVAVLVIVMSAGTLFFVLPDATETAVGTLMQRFSDIDPRDDMRYYAWQQAFVDFGENPIIGTGLGHQLFYFHRGSAGVFVARYSSAHNSYLDSLYQTGIVGFALFIALHIVFIVHFFRRFRSLPDRDLPITIGLFMGYTSILAFSFLEPLQVGSIVTQYLLMGLCVYLLRPSDRALAETTP